MGVYGNIVSFNAGELSPLMSARSDISQYSSGCQTLENFLVTPYGSVFGRPGLQFVKAAKFADKNCRLIPFAFSTTQTYILEFGHHYIRLYADGAPVYDNGGNLIEIDTPYEHTELSDLKYVQSADVLFMAHPLHAPFQFSRVTATSFSFAAMSIIFPAVQDPNDSTTTLIASALSGSGITITASAALFDALHVGSYWEIVHLRKSGTLTGNLTKYVTGGQNATPTTPAGSYSASLEVKGKWGLVTRGIWTGTVIIQRSYDNGATWADFRSYSSTADKNYDIYGDEADDSVLYRVIRTISQSGILIYELKNDNFYTHGVFLVTAVTDSTHATATVIKNIGDTVVTTEWSEAAWSDKAGYPRAVCFFEERLLFAGTKKQPQTIWGSKVGEWNNFLPGANDDEPYSFTVNADDVNTIQWMISQDALLFGTVGGEWKLSANTDGKPVTPSNVSIRRQSNYGSKSIQAQLIGDAVLYVQRQGRKVREFSYDFQKDSYVSQDLTILADHITESGIKETALQKQPDTVLWCVRNDGQIADLTYERGQQVIGWHRHITDGAFESVAVIPGSNDDIVYCVVNRTVRGAAVRYIEKFASRYYDGIKNAVFLDCSISSPTGDDNTISGLDHLEGKTVGVVADGALMDDATVSGGQITLPSPASNVVVGLKYLPVLVPMPLQIQLQDGTSQYRPKRIGNIRIKVYKSIGGYVQANQGNSQQMITRRVSDPVNKAIEPFTGWYEIPSFGGWDHDMQIRITQPDPMPLIITNIAPVFEVNG